MESFSQKRLLGIRCLSTLAWATSRSNVIVGAIAWELLHSCFAEDHSLGKRRLKTFVLDPSLNNLRFGKLTWAISLWDLVCLEVFSGKLLLGLGILRLGNVV